MAAAAKIVGSTELDQQTTVAADNFPGIYRGKRGSHLGVGVARAGLLLEPSVSPWFQT